MDKTLAVLCFLSYIVSCYCVADGPFRIKVEENCDVFADLVLGYNGTDLHSFLMSEPCAKYRGTHTLESYEIFDCDADLYIFLTLDGYRLDKNLLYFKPLFPYIKTLTIKNAQDQFPKTLKEYPNLREFKLIGCSGTRFDLNNFIGIQSPMTICAPYNNIEVVESDFNTETSNVGAFDFSYNKIRNLSNNCFSKFINIKHLNLSHNIIQSLDILTFEGMLQLQTLDISYNQLKEIGHTFVRFMNVVELKINNNNLTSLTETNFMSMVKLEKLNLSTNKIWNIEEGAFKTLKELRELDLSGNLLTRVSRVLLQNNNKLDTLLLDDNRIEKVESESFKGKNISVFNISNNSFVGNIETECFYGTRMNYLNLSGYKISSLEPEAFAGIQANVIDLSKNIIETVASTAFYSVQFIEELDLSNNSLSSLSFETSYLKQLTRLNARHNNIGNIFKSTMKNFTSLRILDLSYNKLRDLEPNLFSELGKLEYLDLSYNLIASVVAKPLFQGLTAIENLQLGWNRFTSVENETFSGLTRLKIVNFTNCEITSIGHETFKGTGAVVQIDISHNLLESVSLNATSISSVNELCLNNNEIKNITCSITKETYLSLPNVKKINLSHNNLGTFECDLLTSALVVVDVSSNAELDIESVIQRVDVVAELYLANINRHFSFENVVNKSVMYLDLSFDYITNINLIFVYKIENIKRLNLKSNKLTFIDKLSFQSMPALEWLDLSGNSIKNIQPGSFIHTSGIKYMNLNENSLNSLQFGVFDALWRLETLNLSNNAIHEFSASLLPTSISKLYLEGNMIEQINIEELINKGVTAMYIGNNPISCHNLVAVFSYLATHPRTKAETPVLLTSERLDFHSENVQGIQCVSKFNNTLNMNRSLTNDNFSSELHQLQKSIDKLKLAIDATQNRTKDVELTNILKYLDSHLVENKNSEVLIIETLKEYMFYMTSLINYTDGTTNRSLRDNNFNEHSELSNGEKEVENKINDKRDYGSEIPTQSEIQVLGYDKENNLRVVINLIGLCLCILTVVTVSKFAYKCWIGKSRNACRKNALSTSNSAIELS